MNGVNVSLFTVPNNSIRCHHIRKHRRREFVIVFHNEIPHLPLPTFPVYVDNKPCVSCVTVRPGLQFVSSFPVDPLVMLPFPHPLLIVVEELPYNVPIHVLPYITFPTAKPVTLVYSAYLAYASSKDTNSTMACSSAVITPMAELFDPFASPLDAGIFPPLPHLPLSLLPEPPLAPSLSGLVSSPFPSSKSFGIPSSPPSTRIPHPHPLSLPRNHRQTPQAHPSTHRIRFPFHYRRVPSHFFTHRITLIVIQLNNSFDSMNLSNSKDHLSF
ncbi:hypothetical protein PIB30_084148 [Stylosanthes scabra]|uniref:Uncharacterized protein n=1 Tax=Stylosanthes scabra TaxID=79078 RepID=A0ABU6XUT4_9FABA|nr:hypothetical protein [Stylosanthes scabra]